MSQRFRPTGLPRRALCAALLCLSGPAAQASVELSFAVDDIQGDGWHARGIEIGLAERAPGSLSVSVDLQELELPDGHGRVLGLHLVCPEAVHGDGGWRCDGGRLTVRDSPVQGQDADWQGEYRPDGWSLRIPGLALAQGTVGLEFAGHDGAWSAQITPNRTAVAPLAALSGAQPLPTDWNVRGRLSGRVQLDGTAGSLSRAKAELVVDQISYASPDGMQAAENGVLGVDAAMRAAGDAWHLDATLRWPRGAVYADPLYIDAGEGPVTAVLSGRWDPGATRLQLDSWTVDVADTVNLSGTGRLQGPDYEIADLTVVLRSDDAERLYRRFLQPFLIGTTADDLAVTGRVGLVLHFDGEGIEQAGLELNQLALEDRQGRFALGSTSGSVGWDRRREVPVSRLTVQGASLYRIPTGGFGISAHFAGERIALVEPVVVPVLGGAVALDSFVLTGALVAGDRPRWEASGSVREVSLEQLTQALEWPPFSGSVSGQLSEMRYGDQLFSVGGGLALNAFGGDIRVDGLAIREPLGSVPILTADATMRGLNLEALTRTFSFGRIEGRLDGDMRDIRLVGWQPDRFDLHLYTPAGDDSRHRISQRAVENLTELGSGVPGGLSAGLLSLFEEFRYDRIDLKIRLEGNVADLDGLARPDGGYYLVRGAGLPRIDVIGRNRSVAWKDLVERLQQIQVEGAQIR